MLFPLTVKIGLIFTVNGSNSTLSSSLFPSSSYFYPLLLSLCPLSDSLFHNSKPSCSTPLLSSPFSIFCIPHYPFPSRKSLLFPFFYFNTNTLTSPQPDSSFKLLSQPNLSYLSRTSYSSLSFHSTFFCLFLSPLLLHYPSKAPF